MKKYKEIILGGGISGLILSYFHPDAFVITRDFGGLVAQSQFNPFMLHYSLSTQQFLNAMKISYHIKLGRFAYYWENDFHSFIPEDLYKEYFKKSRGIEATEIPSYRERSKTTFIYFVLNEKLFIEKLTERIPSKKIYCDDIITIDTQKQIINTLDGSCFCYKKLYSSLPAWIFDRLLIHEHPMGFKSVPKIFFVRPLRERISEFYQKVATYDYVYFPEELIPGLLRISHIHKNFIFEFNYQHCGQIPKKGLTVLSYFLYPKTIFYIPNVEFYGRFAELNENVFVHTTIDRLSK